MYWLQTWDTSVFTQEELDKLKCFAQTDQSGAEALIVAYDCQNADYRQLFINGIKPHVYVALKLFRHIWRQRASEHGLHIEKDTIEHLCNTPISKLKLHTEWRELDLLIKSSDGWPISQRYYYFAKQTCHAANYDIEWFTFSMNVLEKSGGKVVIPKDEAIRYLQEYRGLFPEIPERSERVKRQVRETGIIYNMMGFPYIIWSGGRPPDIKLMDMKPFVAWGPQSTVGEITRRAVSRFYYEFIIEKKNNWDILADTHDSFLTQGDLLTTKDRCAAMQECISQEFQSPIDGAKFKMRSETAIGFNWGKEKKDNILGLREIKI